MVNNRISTTRIFWRAKRRLILALGFALILVFMSSSQAFAVTAPDIEISQPTCYRNLIYDGDVFCISRYNLPTYSTATPPPANPEAWSEYLADKTGTSLATGLTAGARVSPVEATSLLPLHAFTRLYRNYTGIAPPGNTLPTGTSILEQQLRIYRIDHALTGLYFMPGNSVFDEWGNSDIAMCVISSDDIFTTQTGDCKQVQWTSAQSDTTSQRLQLGNDILNLLLELEDVRSVANNSYVIGSKIGSAGRIFVLEAFSVADEIIPTFFQASGGLSITESYATPTGNALQDKLDLEAGTTAIPSSLDTLGSSYFGISGGAFATVLFFSLGIGAFIFIYRFTREPVIPTAGFMMILLVGSFVRAPTVSVLGVLVVVLSLMAGMFIFRKFAS